VINSDEQISRVYEREDVKRALAAWWGQSVFDESGRVVKREIARRVFENPVERKRLEGMLHPMVAQMREQQMADAAQDASVPAYVWDTPLLLEANLGGKCDAIVFVDARDEERLGRVQQSRGWTAEEWQQREKLQLPLDKKREVAKYMVRNTAGAADVRSQVRDVLSRVLAEA
jgi:dephospho-CoA kinase